MIIWVLDKKQYITNLFDGDFNGIDIVSGMNTHVQSVECSLSIQCLTDNVDVLEIQSKSDY